MLTPVLAHGTASLAGDGVSPLAIQMLLVAAAVIATVALRARGPRGVTGAVTPPLGVDRSADRRWPVDALGRGARGALGGLGLGVLGLLLAIGWAGSDLPGASPLPAVLVLAWWLVPITTWLLGDWYRLADPFDALAGLVERARPRPPAPAEEEADDWWLPALLLASFGWLVICWPDGFAPRSMALWLTALTVLMAGGALLGGRAWVRRSSPLAVLTAATSAAAPVDWSTGRPRLRSPLAGLAGAPGGRRSLAAVVVVLGTTIWEAASSTRWWAEVAGADSSGRAVLWSSVGLLWSVLGVAATWTVAARVAEGLAGRAGAAVAEPLATDLALLLAPLVAAAHLGHQIDLILLYVQDLVILGLDPFALGWNLFDSYSWRPNEQVLSPLTLGWIGLVALVAALGEGLLGGWDRLVDRTGSAALTAVWALLGWTLVAGAVVVELLLA